MRNRAGDKPNLGTIQDFILCKPATISSSGALHALFFIDIFEKEKNIRYIYSGIESYTWLILQDQDLAPAGPCHPPAQSDAGTGRRTGKAQRGSSLLTIRISKTSRQRNK